MTYYLLLITYYLLLITYYLLPITYFSRWKNLRSLLLLFSAVSLILLAYTNRFLSYAQLVRQLRDRYMENPTDITVAQIENLRKRLNLTRTMQGLGIASLFFCVVSMFLIYIGLQLLSVYVFGLALILLIASLGVSFREIQISTRSLEIYLGAMEKGKIKK